MADNAAIGALYLKMRRVARTSTAAVAELLAATGLSSQLGTIRLAIVSGAVALLASIGFAATASALAPERTQTLLPPSNWLSSTFTPTRDVVALTAVAVLLLGIGRRPPGRVGVALFASALALAVSGVTLDTVFAPPSTWGRQWQTIYAPNGNLTEGLQLAANLREGHGYVLDGGGVDTYRMPGYAALVAMAGSVSRASARDYEAVAAATIWLQVLLTAAAVGVFVFVAAARLSRIILLPILLILVSLPTSVQFSQGDSVMFAAALFVTAAVLPFLDRARGQNARWRDVLLLHAAFGCYFLLRTDVVFAWALVSVIVHNRRWQHLVVWLVCFVVIGGGYGVYARTHGTEFTFGTNNTGHAAFVGLWQLPQDHFVWKPSDESYDHWIRAHGYTYMGPRTNAFAEKEIARFYATYPGYVTTMAVNKAINYFDSTCVDPSFYTTPFSAIYRFRLILVDGGAWALASTILIALIIGYRRYQTALLGWASLFVLPIFFFVYDESRFTLFETASLAIAATPLLLDPGFYRKLYDRGWVTLSLLIVAWYFWAYHNRIGTTLLNWEAFRYWTPFLDPKSSTLAVLLK